MCDWILCVIYGCVTPAHTRARACCHRRCEGDARAIDVSRRLATLIIGQRLENAEHFLDPHLEEDLEVSGLSVGEDFVVSIAADGLRPSGVPDRHLIGFSGDSRSHTRRVVSDSRY